MHVISMKSLFRGQGEADVSPEIRAALAQADVIVGVDPATQREFTIFGTPSFEDTVQLDTVVAMNTVRSRARGGGGRFEQAGRAGSGNQSPADVSRSVGLKLPCYRRRLSRRRSCRPRPPFDGGRA